MIHYFFLINRELMSIAIDDRSVQMLAALPESSVHEYSTMIKDVELYTGNSKTFNEFGKCLWE